MKIQKNPLKIIDWNKISAEEHAGEKGIALWRTFKSGNVRSRIVEYSPGYTADHFCGNGHTILVLDGELNVRLKDGNECKLSGGMSLILENDEANPHIVYTNIKTKIFIVD